MIRRTITALMLVLMSFGVLVGVPHVQARPIAAQAQARPMSTSCPSCGSNHVWSGTTNGMKTFTNVSSPPLNAGEYWASYATLEDTNLSNTITVGVERSTKGFPGDCGDNLTTQL